MATGIRFLVDVADNNDTPLYTYHVSRLNWSYRLGDVGGAVFEIALTDPALTRDGFAPYANRYTLNLLVGDSSVDPELWNIFPLQAGFITGAQIASERGTVQVSGQDWLAWLRQPYPFLNVVANTGSHVGYDLTLAEWLAYDPNGDGKPDEANRNFQAKTQEFVVNDLITSLTDIGYDPLAPALILAFNGLGWTQTMNYQIPWGDGTGILEHLQVISGQFDPYGFDFWVDWDKTVRLENPRQQNPASVTPSYAMIGPGQIVSIDWTNNGPRATETIVFGAGFGNGRPWFKSRFTSGSTHPSEDLYGRWRRVLSFANPAASVTDNTMVTQMAAGQGYLDRFAQKELRLTVKPDAIDPSDPTAFFFNQSGNAITVTYDFPPYHKIDAFFRVTGQDYRADSEGNWLCDLTLDQIYT